MSLVALKPRPYESVTVLRLDGADYEFGWNSVPVLRGPVVVRWEPELNPASVYSHKLKRRLTWDEFQSETLWFYDQARVEALIYSAETEYDPA